MQWARRTSTPIGASLVTCPMAIRPMRSANCGSRSSCWIHSVSLVFTWWLWSACQITAPDTCTPTCGRVAHLGMAVISASPTASGCWSVLRKTEFGSGEVELAGAVEGVFGAAGEGAGG